MEELLSSQGRSLIEPIVENLATRLGIKQLSVYPLHQLASGVTDRWNRTIFKEIFSFVST